MKALTRELIEVVQRKLATGLMALFASEIAYAGVALQCSRQCHQSAAAGKRRCFQP